MPLAPSPSPCGSCPYRRDVPSGIWAPEEYDKLPPYDRDTPFQPPSVFFCHQQNGRLCAGWVACHDMDANLGLRLAAARGLISDADLDTTLDYTTEVDVFGSGEEAAEHGLAGVEAPDARARAKIAGLERKQRAARR